MQGFTIASPSASSRPLKLYMSLYDATHESTPSFCFVSRTLKLSRELPDDEALTHYLRAICLNRTDDAVGAYEELKRSFEMDPSLEKIAHTDGDVNDLLLEQKK